MSCRKTIKVVNMSAKTINLAKETLRRRPPICGPPFDSKPVGIHPSPAPPAARIRVCSPEQLKSICPPDPCDCPPPEPPPLTTGQKLIRSIIANIKLLLILGVIKWTDDLGIWGDTDSTAKLSESAMSKLAPALHCDGKSDNASGQYYGLSYNLATMWNNTVMKVFYVLGVLPSEGARKITALMSSKKEEEEPPEPPPPPPPPGKKAAAKAEKRRNPMLL